MKKIRLTEADLYKIVKKVIKEDEESEIESDIMNSEEYSELSDYEVEEWNSTQITWKKAIKECLKELDEQYNTTRYSSLPNKYLAILAFIAFLFGLGLATDIKELKFMSLISLMATGVLSHVELQEILICASKKRKGVNQSVSQEQGMMTEPSTSMIESVIRKSLRKIIREEEMDSTGKGKEYTTRKGFGVNFDLYVTDLKGTTPFYVNGKEMKRDITLKPDDKISCKNCSVTLLKTVKNRVVGNYYYITFDDNGNAKFKKG